MTTDTLEQLAEVSAKDVVKAHLDKLGIPQDLEMDDAEFAEKNNASLNCLNNTMPY